MNKKVKLLNIILYALPVLTLAAGADLESVSKNIYNNIFVSIINFLVAATFVFFAWSVLRFIFSEGDKKTEAKDTLFWGVIALFVMLSFWGILRIVNNTFTKDELGENQHYNFESEYKQYSPPELNFKK